MKYPLIILGAGASFDFLKIERFSNSDKNILNAWRAPLTNNLFDISRFSQIISKYHGVKDLASAVTNITDSKNPFNFEDYLSDLELKFPENSYAEIMALRFYLAELFGNISHHFYRHTNNHRHLLFEIQNRIGEALIVNFNYDTLLEKNIDNINQSNEIDSYISGKIKVIKLHGAHNWVYEPITENSDEQDVYNFFTNPENKNKIDKLKNINKKIAKTIDLDRQDFDLNIYKNGKRDEFFDQIYWQYYLPAIAVPIATKNPSTCPESHIKVLEDELKRVDRILVIGWRAQDKFLLELLLKNLGNGIKLEIVSSCKQNSIDIAKEFRKIPQISSIIPNDNEGYTDFLINRRYEGFLN